MRVGFVNAEDFDRAGDFMHHPVEDRIGAGQEFLQESGDGNRVGIDRDLPVSAALAEQRGDLREAGLLEHADHGCGELPLAEDGVGTVAVEQRVFDCERDILGHIAAFAQPGREEAVDEPRLQLDRVEPDALPLVILNIDDFFRWFNHDAV